MQFYINNVFSVTIKLLYYIICRILYVDMFVDARAKHANNFTVIFYTLVRNLFGIYIVVYLYEYLLNVVN